MESRRRYSETFGASSTTTHLFKPVVQTKLAVGASNDSYETEADSVADKVMQMNSSDSASISSGQTAVQRKCAACEEEEKVRRKPLAEHITPLIQRHSLATADASTASPHVESKINNSRGGGSLMDSGTRNFMESRFGTDFSDVRIHTGSEAIQMSRELNAQAFTVGNDIYFNQGKYSPTTDVGKHLLAHELTHTIQQSGKVERKIQKLSDPNCSSTTPMPVSGSCRDCFVHTCYSETFIPATSAALNVSVSVDYCEDPGNTGPEDFSVQVYKCGMLSDTRIGAKRLGGNIPDTLTFAIASVTPGDKYYIKIYSRSHLGLNSTYTISQ
ncbi:DUF4157 domain-containing protein [Flavobacterium sp.]|uniref:eCIS core domain-containing protein n=1 Tax=Flavobacterium sp. TaxID=239 RepID=UPI003D11AFDA